MKGLEVYLWQETDGNYLCGVLSGTNRGKTFEEINNLTRNGATVEQMKDILSSYHIDREIIITNVDTMKDEIRTKTELLEDKPYSVSLRVSDNLDKTNAWYKSKIDVSNLEKGRYVIYVKTKVKEVDDYGEVNDILFTDIKTTMTSNNKKYTILRNDNRRFRLELIVE